MSECVTRLLARRPRDLHLHAGNKHRVPQLRKLPWSTVFLRQENSRLRELWRSCRSVPRAFRALGPQQIADITAGSANAANYRGAQFFSRPENRVAPELCSLLESRMPLTCCIAVTWVPFDVNNRARVANTANYRDAQFFSAAEWPVLVAMTGKSPNLCTK